jgi:hypothetical protein
LLQFKQISGLVQGVKQGAHLAPPKTINITHPLQDGSFFQAHKTWPHPGLRLCPTNTRANPRQRSRLARRPSPTPFRGLVRSSVAPAAQSRWVLHCLRATRLAIGRADLHCNCSRRTQVRAVRRLMLRQHVTLWQLPISLHAHDRPANGAEQVSMDLHSPPPFAACSDST